jgi:hypothetical protein
MLKKALFPGKYIQGAGALRELPGLVNLFGGHGLILASHTAHILFTMDSQRWRKHIRFITAKKWPLAS